MDSLDRLLAVVENERAQQLSHFDALDAKAGVVLGFAGVLVALVPNVAPFFLIPGALLAVAAAAAAVAAYWPREAPRIEPLPLREKYLTAEERFTALKLLDTQVAMIDEAADLLKRKGKWLRIGMTLLVAAVALLGVGILAVGVQGANDERREATTTPTAAVRPTDSP